MITASPKYLSLIHTPLAELAAIMRRGDTPDFARMVGYEYRGFNRPEFLEPAASRALKLLGIQKFIKGFYQSVAGDNFGYNEPVVQTGPKSPWIARPDPNQPKRFGFYRVVPVDKQGPDNRYPQALFLDYGAGPNPPWEPARILRDYLVRVFPGQDNLLLGAATVALGTMRFQTNFFVLEKHQYTGWRP